MKIYDYTKYDKCFLGPSADGNLDKLIEHIYSNLPEGREKKMHPKEIERLERLKKRNLIGLDFGAHPMLKERPLQKHKFNDSVIIVAGNSGFGTKKIEYFIKLLTPFNDALAKNNIHVLFIRGNNDDPSYFDEEKISFSNIKLLNSVCLVRLSSYSCLCVGGGISFDREWKKEKSVEYGFQMYWENENVRFDISDVSECIKSENIACVISNEIPTFLPPGTNSYKNSRWYKNDSTLLTDTLTDRAKMDSIYVEFVKADKKPYVWWYASSDNFGNLINDIYFRSSKNIQSLKDIINSNFGIEPTKKIKEEFSGVLEEFVNTRMAPPVNVERNIMPVIDYRHDFDEQDNNFDY
jgi:hypothetical protein